MASRKKVTLPADLSIFRAQQSLGTPLPQGVDNLTSSLSQETTARPPASPMGDTIDAFDDYDTDEGVDPPKLVTVIVEAAARGFWVSRLRHDGTSIAGVHWTREELEELQRRIAAALEMG